MSKYVISFLLLLVTATAFCQKKSKVNLISSTRSHGDKLNGVDIIKVYDGVWKQDYSIMRSDSAYFYPSANAFEAFGHVNINQGDTLNIYSDKLHYDGNTKIAVLTDNVVMVDKDATLTTNQFTYNTATRIGTYTEGGKLVSKTNTLTSTNGYYFSFTHDAYFRYNVVGKTTDALIYTDTMRYNSQTKINYFYGPTRIYGTKDKDTLLTENGTYDTKTEQANFIKKNLYKQGTKTLIGDTLFYDRLVGYGRAVKHVTFNDEEQKVTIKGGLGTYFKKNDLAIVTRDPYIIMVTEDDDTTKKSDTVKKPLLTKAQTDSLAKVAAKQGKKGNVTPQKQGPLSMGTLPIMTPSAAQLKKIDSLKGKLTMPVIDSFSKKLPPTDSIKKLAARQSKNIDKGTKDKLGAAIKGAKPDTNSILSHNPVATKKTKVKTDSVYMSADTIETQIVTFKELVQLKKQDSIAHIIDTSKVKIIHIVYKVAPKEISLVAPRLPKDTSFWHHDYFGPPKPKPVKKKSSSIVSSKPKKNIKPDSTFYTKNVVLSDTARIRIIKAFHKGKIFKSDLQAVADSIFYSNSDSTIRCYQKPMIWAEGSQLSGDTVNLQLKNKKLDKMDMFPNAFIVNVEKEDSTHFNQVGGKKMRGFFKNSKLSRVYVDGNAETIYFVRDSTTKQITDMQRSSSSRIWVYMKNNEVTDLGFITKPENRYIPIHVVKEDEKILKGFLWKPKDRPVSKESILPSYNHKADTSSTKPKPGVSAGVKAPNGKTTGKNITPPGKPGGVKAAQDTALKTPAINAGKDTSAVKSPAIKPAVGAGKDTTKAKTPPVVSPAVQTKKDTTGGKP